DRAGRFRADQLPLGDYVVEIGSVGWTTRFERGVVISEADPTVELGQLQLTASALELEEVVASVDAPPMRVASDRTIYSVGEMSVAAGGVATDALQNVPELQVDVEGNITAMGATPAIHLNGRPAPMQGEALTMFLQ